jgi:hypothetical protein
MLYLAFHRGWAGEVRSGVCLTVVGALLLLYAVANNIGWDRLTRPSLTIVTGPARPLS